MTPNEFVKFMQNCEKACVIEVNTALHRCKKGIDAARLRVVFGASQLRRATEKDLVGGAVIVYPADNKIVVVYRVCKPPEQTALRAFVDYYDGYWPLAGAMVECKVDTHGNTAQ